MTLASQLTVLRIVLTACMIGLLFVPGFLAKALCVVLFLLASMTDWLDGYLARRFHQVTPFGILLDPIADKILVLGLLTALIPFALVPVWMVAVIVIRELLVTAVRLSAARRHVVIPATKEGKQKAAFQMATIFLALLALVLREVFDAPWLPSIEQWLHVAIRGCLWVALLLTVSSGISFFWRNRWVLLRLSRP